MKKVLVVVAMLFLASLVALADSSNLNSDQIRSLGTTNAQSTSTQDVVKSGSQVVNTGDVKDESLSVTDVKERNLNGNYNVNVNRNFNDNVNRIQTLNNNVAYTTPSGRIATSRVNNDGVQYWAEPDYSNRVNPPKTERAQDDRTTIAYISPSTASVNNRVISTSYTRPARIYSTSYTPRIYSTSYTTSPRIYTTSYTPRIYSTSYDYPRTLTTAYVTSPRLYSTSLYGDRVYRVGTSIAGYNYARIYGLNADNARLYGLSYIPNYNYGRYRTYVQDYDYDRDYYRDLSILDTRDYNFMRRYGYTTAYSGDRLFSTAAGTEMTQYELVSSSGVESGTVNVWLNNVNDIDQAFIRLTANNLQVVNTDKVYETWLVDDDSGYALSIGAFTVDNNGRGMMRFQQPMVNFNTYDRIVVTEETRFDENPQPSDAVVLSADLKNPVGVSTGRSARVYSSRYY